MIHARKVDVMNKKLKNGTPSGSSNGATGEKSGFYSISRFKTSLIKNTPGEDLEGKKWWWYTILVSVAIILVYALPEEHEEYRFAVGGWFILIALHLIVWPFFTEKTSLIAKVTMTAFILFFTNAAVFPKAAVFEVERFTNWRKTFDDNYGKAPASESAQQSVATSANNKSESQIASQTYQIFPGERFKKVSLPPGRIIKDLTWDCPDGCILEIVHDGQPLCPATNIYQGLPCGSLQPEIGNGGTERNREQFAMPYGNFIKFPRNLVLIGVSFGTDENLGPIEVTATVTI